MPAIQKIKLPYQNSEIILSLREFQVLLRVGLFWSNPAIAKDLQVCVGTIEYYIKSLNRKLNCYTKRHLIHELIATDFFGYTLPPVVKGELVKAVELRYLGYISCS